MQNQSAVPGDNDSLLDELWKRAIWVPCLHCTRHIDRKFTAYGVDLVHLASMVAGGRDTVDVQVACDFVRLALKGGVDDGSHPILCLLDQFQQSRLQTPLQPCTPVSAVHGWSVPGD